MSNGKEKNSEDLVLEGYISNIDLKEDNTKDAPVTIVDTVAQYRSAIYSKGIEFATEGMKNPKLLRFAGGLLTDSPFTAIGIMINAKEEGILQATITGIGASGITVASSVYIVGPALGTAGLSATASFVAASIIVGAVAIGADYILDGAYIFAKEKLSEIRINEEQKSLILETSLTNANDLKTLIEPLVLFGKVEKDLNLNEIIINQNIDGETSTYIVQKDNTIWGICEKYGMTYDELIEANPWLAERFSSDRSFALIRPEESLKNYSQMGYCF